MLLAFSQINQIYERMAELETISFSNVSQKVSFNSNIKAFAKPLEVFLETDDKAVKQLVGFINYAMNSTSVTNTSR